MRVDESRRRVPFPRGVASPDEKSGFVAAAGDRIEAINLTTGDLLWSSDAASRPLIVIGQQLVSQMLEASQPNAMRIVLLDVEQKGRVILESDPIVFPPWVSIAEADEESFSVDVVVDAPALYLTWRAHARYKGGAPPSPQILERATKDEEGTIRVDLETGQVDVAAHHIKTPTRSSRRLQDLTSQPYRRGHTWHTEPWLAGDRLAALGGEPLPDKEPLSLQLWDPSSGQMERTILLAETGPFQPTVTLDGRYLFLLRSAPQPVQRAAAQDWLVVSVDTGEPVAQMRLEPGIQELCVLAGQVYYIAVASDQSMVEHALMARSLATGQLLWERTMHRRRASAPPSLRQ